MTDIEALRITVQEESDRMWKLVAEGAGDLSEERWKERLTLLTGKVQGLENVLEMIKVLQTRKLP